MSANVIILSFVRSSGGFAGRVCGRILGAGIQMRAATSCPSFPFFPFAFFFVPKAPFVRFSYVIVVKFKPEKVSCLMANSIQFYYPQESTEAVFPLYLCKLHFNTTSSTCWVFFFSVRACIHFVSILHSCGLFTSQRTPFMQTWCKQKSLINLT